MRIMDEMLRASVLVMSLLNAPAPVQEPKQDNWLGSDKAKHVWMSYVTTAFTFAAVYSIEDDTDLALTVAVPVAAVVGIGKETFDRRRGERFSLKDLVADAAGIAAGLLPAARGALMELLVITIIAVVAFALVLIPLFRRGPRGDDEREFGGGARTDAAFVPIGAGPATPIADVTEQDGREVAVDDVEREVLRYRTAVRAGTICRKCGQANPADSLFCFECGAQLQRADAKEFE